MYYRRKLAFHHLSQKDHSNDLTISYALFVSFVMLTFWQWLGKSIDFKILLMTYPHPEI